MIETAAAAIVTSAGRTNGVTSFTKDIIKIIKYNGQADNAVSVATDSNNIMCPCPLSVVCPCPCAALSQAPLRAVGTTP